MKLVYPACFYKEDDGGYSVVVPDLKGCCTQGDTLEDAIEMAQDAALGWLLLAVEDNETIPQASDISDVQLEFPNGFNETGSYILICAGGSKEALNGGN